MYEFVFPEVPILGCQGAETFDRVRVFYLEIAVLLAKEVKPFKAPALKLSRLAVHIF
jgi:hypothetical protein